MVYFTRTRRFMHQSVLLKDGCYWICSFTRNLTVLIRFLSSIVVNAIFHFMEMKEASDHSFL